jgi:hypothetical protein
MSLLIFNYEIMGHVVSVVAGRAAAATLLLTHSLIRQFHSMSTSLHTTPNTPKYQTKFRLTAAS